MTPAYARQAQQAIERGDFQGAARALDELVKRAPRDHGAWHKLAAVCVRGGRADLALAAVRRAIGLDKLNAEYHNTHGVVLAELGAHQAAIAAFRKATKIRPYLTNGYYNLGKLLHKLRQLDAAVDAHARARKLDPGRTDIREMWGMAMLEAGRIEAVQRDFAQWVRQQPDSPEAARCFAISTAAFEGWPEAGKRYEEALLRFPADPHLHWMHARLLLGSCNFAEGWAEYLWRPSRDPRYLPRPGAAFAALTPALLAGEALRLEQEQGIGDALFFSRFVPQLRQAGTRILLGCNEKLAPLMRRLGVFDQVNGERPAEVTTLLDDLPALLKATEAAATLELDIGSQETASWKARLDALGPRPHIALTWRAGTDNSSIAEFAHASGLLYKEFAMPHLAQALRGVAGTLVAIQRAPRAGEIGALAEALGRPVHDFSALNDDLEAMCGLLSALDDYIGVSNTNMHLSAALGRAARVLVPYPPEWRWTNEGGESPWFPGFKIYRQRPDRSWGPAIAQLQRDLSQGRA